MSHWDAVKIDFKGDPFLRDIYAFDMDKSQWDTLLKNIKTSKLNFEFWHSDQKKDLPDSFSKIIDLQNTNPTTLTFHLDCNIQINCHFFDDCELEMSLSHEAINDEPSFQVLESFMQWLADSLSKKVRLAMESNPDRVFLEIVPTGN